MGYISIVMGGLMLSMCTVTSAVTCADLKAYSPEFQAQAAEDLDKASPEIQQLVNDYGDLRAAVRVCEDHRTPR